MKTVDFANYADNGLLFVSMQNGIMNAAKTLGVNVQNYNNQASASTTLENAKIMAQGNPNLVLEYDPVADVGPRLGQTFASAGIKCIAVNIPFSGCPWFNQSDSALAKQMAQQMAKLMKQRNWSGANSTVVIMDHPQDGPSVNTFVWQCYADLAALVPRMSRVPLSKITASTTSIGSTGLQIDGGDTENTAYAAFQAGLSSIPSNRNIVLFTIDDIYTVPAYRALVQAGRQGHSMISGFGASSQALTALRTNPSWVLEADSFFSQWGEFLLAMGQALLNGTKPPAQTLPPQIALTKGNVNTFYPPGSGGLAKELPALPPVDAYIIKTGVLQKFHNVQGVH
ncbi:MAG: sugar ABC transporter substrate-binding protein [Streptosporangiaceae bacterium]